MLSESIHSDSDTVSDKRTDTAITLSTTSFLYVKSTYLTHLPTYMKLTSFPINPRNKTCCIEGDHDLEGEGRGPSQGTTSAFTWRG